MLQLLNLFTTNGGKTQEDILNCSFSKDWLLENN